MSTNDGGPAFPVECVENADGTWYGMQTGPLTGWRTGMSLRDYFAAAALTGIVAGTHADAIMRKALNDLSAAKSTSVGLLTAAIAFNLADAMLAERSKTEGTP